MDSSGRRSSNVEDRRGRGGQRIAAGAGLGVLALVVVGSLLGVDPRLLSLLSQVLEAPPAEGPAGPPAADDPEASFASVVLASTEDGWGKRFAAAGSRYPEPVLVLFRDAVRSACGSASSAVGPFYCPADQKLYVDLDFLGRLTRRLGADGDFARAYVIAHEVGHHVQNVLGQMNSDPRDNAASVRVELQADCYAGIWAHDAERLLGVVEPGDLEEAMTAAAAVGDDRLQEMAGQAVSPESFTHGSSEERVRWFTTGYRTGQLEACDTAR